MGDINNKIYIRGSVTRGREITDIFTNQFKCNNPMEYRCGDADGVYFINHKNELDYAGVGSPLYHVLVNSDWKELKLREPRKTRKYILTVQEGETDCNTCQFAEYCGDERKSKCRVSEALSSFNGIKLDGSTMSITDFTDSKTPPTPECLWPKPWH